MPKYKKVRPNKRTNVGYELITLTSGTKVWCLNGARHREDGPAIAPSSNNKQWYLKGKRLDKDWFIKHPKKIKSMKAWELFTPEELIQLKDKIQKKNSPEIFLWAI